MCAGYDAIKKKFDEINDKGFEAAQKESALADELQLAMEMHKRGIRFKMIDLKICRFRPSSSLLFFSMIPHNLCRFNSSACREGQQQKDISSRRRGHHYDILRF